MAELSFIHSIKDNTIYVDVFDGDTKLYTRQFSTETEPTQDDVVSAIRSASTDFINSNDNLSLANLAEPTPSKSSQAADLQTGKVEDEPLLPSDSSNIKEDNSETQKLVSLNSKSSSTSAAIEQIKQSLVEKPENPNIKVDVNVTQEKSTEDDQVVEKMMHSSLEAALDSSVNDDKPSKLATSDVSEKTSAANSKNETASTKTEDPGKGYFPSKDVTDPPTKKSEPEQSVKTLSMLDALKLAESTKKDSEKPTDVTSTNTKPSTAAVKPPKQQEPVKSNNQGNFDLSKINNPADKLFPTSTETKSDSSIKYVESGYPYKAEEPAVNSKSEKEKLEDKTDAILNKIKDLQKIGWLNKEIVSLEPLKPSSATDSEKSKEENSQPLPSTVSKAENSTDNSQIISKKSDDLSKFENKISEVTNNIQPSVNNNFSRLSTELGDSFFNNSETNYIDFSSPSLLTQLIRNTEQASLSQPDKADLSNKVLSSAEPTKPKSLPIAKKEEAVATVKNGEKKITPDLRKAMTETLEAKRLNTIEDSLKQLQSAIVSLTANNVQNSNTQNIVNQGGSSITNVDNTSTQQVSKPIEIEPPKKQPEKKEESTVSLSEFYLHAIYDAMVSQGIKIKSY